MNWNKDKKLKNLQESVFICLQSFLWGCALALRGCIVVF